MDVVRKVLVFLTPREKRQMYWLCLSLVTNAIIDTIGVVSIFPFLSVVANPEVINTNEKLRWVYERLSFATTTRFLLVLGICVLAILVVSNLFRCFTTWTIYYFSLMKRHNVSKRLLRSYLHENFTFFLNRNSAELTAHLLTNVNSAVSGVLIQCMQMFANIMVSLFVTVLLIILDPTLALILSLIFGLAYALLYLSVRNRLKKSGSELVKTNTALHKILGESFGGVKEIKLRGKEEVFVERYSEHSKQYMRCYAIQQAVSLFPHYAFEVLAFGGILIITLYLIASKENFQQLIPLIGLYAFAARRLIPAFQAIFQALSQIRVCSEALDVVHNDFVNRNRIDKNEVDRVYPVMPIDDHIEFRRITFSYPGAGKPALKDISLVVQANTTIGVVGRTGAGKTTAIDILLGLLIPDSGDLIVDGNVIHDHNIRKWQSNIGYVPQQIFLSDDTVAHNIAFGIPDHEIDHEAVETAARLANIHEFVVDELSEGYDTLVGERGIRLSGGQRQRFGIARALYHDPSVIVLDEATSALDSVTEDIVMEAIHRLTHQKTIVIIAHRLSTVKQCDTIFMFEKGELTGAGRYMELEKNNIHFHKMAKAFAN